MNPFRTIVVDCPLAIEEAWQRLVGVTKEYSGLPFLTLLKGFAEKNPNIRYAGKLDRYRFTLKRRPNASRGLWKAVNYPAASVIGAMIPNGAGCRITFRLLPPLLGVVTGVLFIGTLLFTAWIVQARGESLLIVLVVAGVFGARMAPQVYWLLRNAEEEEQFLRALIARGSQSVSGSQDFSQGSK